MAVKLKPQSLHLATTQIQAKLLLLLRIQIHKHLKISHHKKILQHYLVLLEMVELFLRTKDEI